MEGEKPTGIDQEIGSKMKTEPEAPNPYAEKRTERVDTTRPNPTIGRGTVRNLDGKYLRPRPFIGGRNESIEASETYRNRMYEARNYIGKHTRDVGEDWSEGGSRMSVLRPKSPPQHPKKQVKESNKAGRTSSQSIQTTEENIGRANEPFKESPKSFNFRDFGSKKPSHSGRLRGRPRVTGIIK